MKKIFTLLISLALSTILQAQADKVYGLNFVGSTLQFAEMNLNDGSVQILSNGPISPDAFSSGVADFDPISKSYFYTRGSGSNTQIFRVDALTGNVISEPIIDNSTGAVVPITNIAYNWMDDVLYGASYEYDGVNTFLKLASVEPATGTLTLISSTPTSNEPYISGNSDIDPINRRYFYGTPENLYIVDLDTGDATTLSISYPDPAQTQFFTNLTYNWLDEKIYGLHFLSIPDPNPFDTIYFTSELRLATIDLQSGVVSLISQDLTSFDGYSSGDCDIDPANNRYFYIRQQAMHIIDLTSGEVLNIVPIENNNNAVAPIINMAYDDLSLTPPTLPMSMPETFELEVGETLEMNVWVGDDVDYLWSDGSTEAIRTITVPGTYSVEISRGGFTVNASTIVEMTTSNTAPEQEATFDVFPIPADEVVYIEFSRPFSQPVQVQFVDAIGKLVKTTQLSDMRTGIDVSNLPTGTYFVQLEGFEDEEVRKLTVVRK